MRDPIDRIISHYYYVKRNPSHYLYKAVTEAGMSLEAYGSSGLSSELLNNYTTHFSGLSTEALIKDPEAAISLAFERILKTYHIIGFLEYFDQFAHELAAKAHLHRPYGSEKKNATLDRPQVGEVPDSAIEAISKANQIDITLYTMLQKELLKK